MSKGYFFAVAVKETAIKTDKIKIFLIFRIELGCYVNTVFTVYLCKMVQRYIFFLILYKKTIKKTIRSKISLFGRCSIGYRIVCLRFSCSRNRKGRYWVHFAVRPPKEGNRRKTMFIQT